MVVNVLTQVALADIDEVVEPHQVRERHKHVGLAAHTLPVRLLQQGVRFLAVPGPQQLDQRAAPVVRQRGLPRRLPRRALVHAPAIARGQDLVVAHKQSAHSPDGPVVWVGVNPVLGRS